MESLRDCEMMQNSFTSIRSTILAAIAITMTFGATDPAQTTALINIVPLIVRTPHSGFNRMVVSVTVCEPDTARCATIDNVMVDTGSTGLRLEASAIPPSLRLPAFFGPEDRPLAECLHFVHDTAWGLLHRADLHMGGLTARDLPIQIIADGGQLQPAECPVSTVQPTSNGTLGIGPWLVDCPGDCEQDPGHPGVFVESEGKWTPVRGSVPRAYRLPNPVSLFPEHDNGVAFDLPSPPTGGAERVVGTLTFGLDAASDHQLDGAPMLSIDGRGRFVTLYGGRSYPDSYIDSGTETNLIPDGDMPRCEGMPWAYCASPERILDATLVGQGGTSLAVRFKVGDYRGALDRHVGAWNGFAEASEQSSRAFVWGAPFFLGRRVYLVLDGRRVPGVDGAIGPAYAVR